MHSFTVRSYWDSYNELSQDVKKVADRKFETFEKCSVLVKVKEGENSNHRNILNISRIEI